MTFLREKLAGTSVADLLFMQIESLTIWIVGTLPTLAGFAIRYALFKLLFGELRGFCWIQPRVMFVQSNRLRVGRNFGCNSGAYINAVGGIEIGDDVLIGANVTISSGKHGVEGRHPSVFARPVEPLPIRIGDDVWIGAGAVIMPGVTLARGTVIGANSVVTRDTPEYSINIGAPARTTRYRIDA